jgi:acetyl esterase/lipase
MFMVAALFICICTAQPVKEIILFPNGAPNETAGAVGPESREPNDGEGCGPLRNIPCDHIYNVTNPTLTPFIVKNGTGASVIIAPGGGYTDLAWTKEGLDMAFMFNKIGVSAFVLKYRVPARKQLEGLPKWWAPLQDAQRAFGLVRANSKTWGLDDKKIGFIGFSAGGHLSAHISTAWRNRIYPKQDASDDLSCRPDFSMFVYPWMLLENNKRTSTTISPELADIQKDHPPTFFCSNMDDNTAYPENSFQYAIKLLGAQAPKPTLHLYPKGGHAFGLCQTMKAFEEVCDWPQAARRWLQDGNFTTGFPTDRHALPCQGN